MKTYHFVRELPVEAAYDLVVAGGGPAGCAAAICAARLGAKVLLAEATGCLGGMGTSGLVTAFDPMADGERALVGGFMGEVVETMWQRGYIAPGVTPDYWRWMYHRWTPFHPEGLKRVYDDLAQAAGVEVRFFTRVIDADVDPTRHKVNGVILNNVEGSRYVPAKTFVDATGDAVLASLCGAPCREAGRDTPGAMPPTLCSLYAGIDWDATPHKADEEWLRRDGADKPMLDRFDDPQVEQHLREAFAAGEFTQPDPHLPGMWKIGHRLGYLNGGHLFHTDALRCASLTQAMMLGRKLAEEYTRFYRKYVPGCENIEHVTTANLLGVRESRRIVGEYELTIDDYLARRQFPDQIGVFNKFVDIHVMDTSPEEYARFQGEAFHDLRLRRGECFGLPYGILVPRGWANLWVAGRCNSSDVKVHGSIRVQPAAAMMGQAAGTAAVQSARTGQPACDLDTAALVETLREAGAYLPQREVAGSMTRG